MSKRSSKKKKNEATCYPLMVIVWDDHQSSDNWVPIEGLEKEFVNQRVRSVGWLVREDDVSYDLASTIGETDLVTTNIMHILKGTVVLKKVLRKC